MSMPVKPVKPPGLGDPKLRVSPRWASQVSNLCVEVEENVSKLKTFQFRCPNFHEIHGFSKRIQHTFGWESGFERGPASAT